VPIVAVELPPAPRETRAAELADWLAQGVRKGVVRPSLARRIIMQELRIGNANRKLKIRPRSVGAQAIIDSYERDSRTLPRNDSDDALHADHYGVITSQHVAKIMTVDAWLIEIGRMRRSVVCLTAAEHRSLDPIEDQGHLGPEKYALAGIEFVDKTLPWDGQTPVPRMPQGPAGLQDMD
jgi:hypothetical protein